LRFMLIDDSVPDASLLRAGRGGVWLAALARSGLLTAISAAALVGVVAVGSRCRLSWVGMLDGGAMTFAGYGVDRIYDAHGGARRAWTKPLSVAVVLIF
jgi:hypothetical protein